ncbi:hypothetical protein GC174_16140 [bacterium]|nr:hypothetical protein [bacterium]
MPPFLWILLLNAFATFSMTGIIWFVQIVHYPLFASVGSEQFAEYENLHQHLTTLVVAPLMLTELFTALALPLLILEQPARFISVLALILILAIFAATAFVQVPIHDKLSTAYSASLIDRLVYTNWVRTLLWSVRSVAVVAILLSSVQGLGGRS